MSSLPAHCPHQCQWPLHTLLRPIPALAGALLPPGEQWALGQALPTPGLHSVVFPLLIKGVSSLSGVSTHPLFLQEAPPDPAHHTSRASLTCPSLPRKPGTLTPHRRPPGPPQHLAHSRHSVSVCQRRASSWWLLVLCRAHWILTAVQEVFLSLSFR